MPRYFPSKKVFVVGVLAIALLAWAIVYQGTSQQNRTAIHNSVLKSVAHAESAFPDSDKDGLYNWEETLYGTDVNNPDSDGDGVLDGKQYVPERKSLSVRASDSVYSAVSRVGEEIQNTPNPVDLLSQSPKEYEDPFYASNLKLRGDSVDDHREYVTEVLVALSKHESILVHEPLRVADEWLETKSPSKLEELNALSEETKSVALSLLEIKVPSHFTSTHLSIVNNLYLSTISLNDISATTLDPMAGFFAAAGYANYQSKYLNSVNELIELGLSAYE